MGNKGNVFYLAILHQVMQTGAASTVDMRASFDYFILLKKTEDACHRSNDQLEEILIRFRENKLMIY